MNRKIVVLCWAAGICANIPSFANAGDTMRSVERQLIERSSKIRSMYAKIATLEEAKTDTGSRRLEGSGDIAYLKKGGKDLYRVKTRHKAVYIRDGNEMKMSAYITWLDDGEFLYVISIREGQRTFAKTNREPPPTLAVETTFKALRQDHSLKLLPDETVDGIAVYVIQATPTDPDKAPAKKVMYFQKDNGMMIKSVEHDDEGAVTTTRFTDIELNVEFPKDAFVFTLPPDAELLDYTK